MFEFIGVTAVGFLVAAILVLLLRAAFPGRVVFQNGGSKQERKVLALPAPAADSSQAQAVDMTPPALQDNDISTAMTVVKNVVSVEDLQEIAITAPARSGMATKSVRKKRTLVEKTANDLVSQWYSIPGISLRKAGEPMAVRSADPARQLQADQLRKQACDRARADRKRERQTRIKKDRSAKQAAAAAASSPSVEELLIAEGLDI